jgi:hypothetical protein
MIGHLIELPTVNERQSFMVEKVKTRSVATTPPARCPGVVARSHRRQGRLCTLQSVPDVLR